MKNMHRLVSIVAFSSALALSAFTSTAAAEPTPHRTQAERQADRSEREADRGERQAKRDQRHAEHKKAQGERKHVREHRQDRRGKVKDHLPE